MIDRIVDIYVETDKEVTELSKITFIIVFLMTVILGVSGGVALGQLGAENPNVIASPLAGFYEDTDGDGLSDIAERNNPHLKYASPNRRDIFVEIDYMNGYKPSQENLTQVRKSFADLEMKNPDGSTGVRVHFIIDDEIPSQNFTSLNDARNTYKPTYFDNSGHGYHYMLMVKNATSLSVKSPEGYSTVGVADLGISIVEHSWRTGETMTHELGHQVGLGSDAYVGIDSNTISCQDYPSTMNYNCHVLLYINGFAGSESQFNDSSYIESNFFTPSTTKMDMKYLSEIP